MTSALLDRVRVVLPGEDESVPLEEVASISVKDGTTLIISVFEDHVRTPFFFLRILPRALADDYSFRLLL